MERYRSRSFQDLENMERRKRVEERIKELKRQKKSGRRARQEKRKPPVRRRIPGKRSLASYLLLALLFATFIAALVQVMSSGVEANLTEEEFPARGAVEVIEALSEGSKNLAPPKLSARSAILIDGETRQVLFQANSDERLPNASTTKILTAIVVLEKASLADRVVVSERAATTSEQSIWLKAGEMLTVEQLLYALLVQSANDAAVALAEHVGGSVEGFVEMMNQKAEEIGATSSHFVNPHGLDQKDHYTTARDLAIITAYAMENPEFRKIINTQSYEIPWPGNPYPRVCENHNKLLKIYPYANGVKTGYTNTAGKCLVGSAEKDGHLLISVVLNDNSFFEDSAALLEYGFEEFMQVDFVAEGDPILEVRVGEVPERRVKGISGESLSRLVRKDKALEAINGVVQFHQRVPFPVSRGERLGTITFEVDGDRVEVPVVAQDQVKPPNIIFRIIYSMIMIWVGIFKALIPGI